MSVKRRQPISLTRLWGRCQRYRLSSRLPYGNGLMSVCGLLAYAAQVAAVAGVNLDGLALVDEEGHTDSGTRLNCGRLSGVSSGIALDARFAVCNLQRSLYRHLGQQDGAVRGIGNHLDHVAFLHILNTGNLVRRDRYLLECFLIHEDTASGILIEILIGATLYAYVLELEANLEGTFQHTAVSYILQFGNHNGVTFARLSVLEVDASPDLAIHADASSDFDFL